MDNSGGYNAGIGCYRLPVLVLIVLVIIGAILLSMPSTPPENQPYNQPKNPVAPPQEDTGYAKTPDLAPTEAALAEKARIQATETSLKATAAAQAQKDLEVSRAYSAATLQVLETQSAILQVRANAASTQTVNQRSQSEAASRTNELNGQLNVALILSAGVAFSLMLIAAGMVIYRNQDAQRKKEAAAAAYLVEQRRLVEADIRKIEVQLKLVLAQRDLESKKVLARIIAASNNGNGNNHHSKTEPLSWPAEPPLGDDKGFPDLPFAE